MAIRKIKPTTPGQRFMTVSAYEEITCKTPEKSLLEDLRLSLIHIYLGSKSQTDSCLQPKAGFCE